MLGPVEAVGSHEIVSVLEQFAQTRHKVPHAVASQS